MIKKYSKKNNKTIKEEDEINVENISISDSISDESDNENDILKEFVKKNSLSFTENKKNVENSSSISEDNPELYKVANKILNNEKNNSSFKDDKSTKVEFDKITYSEA